MQYGNKEGRGRMSSQRVSVDGLADAVMEALDEYKDLTDEVVTSAVTKVSDQTKKIAQSGSPVKTGGYKKGWAVKKTSEKSGELKVTVYNRRKPGLTHLLEKGHAKRGGGRVSAKIHIAPAEEYAVSQLESEIRKGLS
jgi:hypothetical protein